VGAETALVERALSYTLCALRCVTGRALDGPTPCRGWDLRALLWHTNDSLCAMCEGVEDGRVAVPPPVGSGAAACQPAQEGPDAARRLAARVAAQRHGGDDPAAAVRSTAARLLGAWAAAGSRCEGVVAVAGLPLTAAAVARAGALEVAVHGWDIARAAGLPRPVPAALATELIRTARESVPTPVLRSPLFGPPVAVSADADPSDRLVAFLGRDPCWGLPGRRGVPGGPGTPEADAPPS
jgi:uncharacterized protein (TIGR03086 family)